MKKRFLKLLLGVLVCIIAATSTFFAANASESDILISDTSSIKGFGEMAMGVFKNGPQEGMDSIYMQSNHDVRFTHTWVGSDISSDTQKALTFWIYFSEKRFLTTVGQIELGSSGGIDDANEFTWNFGALYPDLAEGVWNKIALQIIPQGKEGSNQTGTVNLQAVNFFRFYNIADGAYDGGSSYLKILISNLKIEEINPEDFNSLGKVVQTVAYSGELPTADKLFIVLENGVHIGENGTPPSVYPQVQIDTALPQIRVEKEGCLSFLGLSTVITALALFGLAAFLKKTL